MTDPIVLDTLDTILADVQNGDQLLAASPHVDLTWMRGASVADFVVRHEPPASLVAEATILIDDNGVFLGRLGAISIELAAPPEGERPLLMRITVGAAPSMALYDMRIGVDLAQPWLRRVDPVTWLPINEPFRFEADAAITVALDGRTDFQVFGLSIPPVEIGRTGIIVSLDDCQLAAGGSGVPLSLRDLIAGAGTPEFNGLYARRARLAMMPQFRFPESPLPGFSLNFRDVLIDDTGVSFILDETWHVEREAGAAHRISTRSAMLGRLFDDRLRIAVAHAEGRVVQNLPVGLSIDTLIEIAPIRAILNGRFTAEHDLQTDEGFLQLSLEQEAGTTIDVDLGVGTLEIQNFISEGAIRDDSIEVSGSARFAIDVPGWDSGWLDVSAAFSTDGESTSISVELPEMDLGPLGHIENAKFNLGFSTEEDVSTIDAFGVTLVLTWRDIAARLGFGALPPGIPQPPQDAEVTASITWNGDGSLKLTLDASSGDPVTLFRFLPPNFRPEVRSVGFGFSATYANANNFFTATAADAVNGEAYARVSFRPVISPLVQDSGVIALHAGDDEGFIDAEIRAALNAGGSTSLSLNVISPVSLDFSIPGVTDEPLLVAELTRATMTLAAGAAPATATATIEFSGTFGVIPAALNLSNSFFQPIRNLVEPIMSVALTGTVTATLTLNDDEASLALSAELDNAGIEADLMELIGTLANGPGVQDRAEPPAQVATKRELDINLVFSFSLVSLKVQVGEIDSTEGARVPASFEMHFVAAVGGAELHAFVRVSDTELVIGVEDGTEIPLRLPDFPIRPDDMDALSNGTGVWTDARFGAALAAIDADIDAISDSESREARKKRGLLLSKRGMIDFLHESWSALSNDAARRNYQDGTAMAIDVLSDLAGLTHSDSDIRLVIGEGQLRLPFDDPRSIAVEGQASLTGFATDDPFHGLEGLTLRLGLSPDQIYFGLEASGEPIPIPRIGRYDDGHVSLSQATIGYGFTRNSLAMSFAGELKYPDGLTEDVDTSRLIGFGVKLPQYNRVSFRLDMIPVPGPIPVVPVFEFSVDLRTPGVPPIRSTATCEPAWDGLELRIPGLIRADLKMLAASPLFGIIPAPNIRYDGDLDIGNSEFGLTIVCDNLLGFAGVGATPQLFPIPFLFDPGNPFFDHLCVNVRCAGFGINFNLERPFPLPNPLLLFEVLSLVADPLAPIDPDGPLARSIRIALTDAHISIPPWAQPFIPGGREIVQTEINTELNLGTLITAAQWVGGTVPPLLRQAQTAFETSRAAIEDMANNPPTVNIDEIVSLLPPELRAIDCQLTFAGFDASATLILIAPQEARRIDEATNAIWQLPALRRFSRADLNTLPAVPSAASAILVAAELDLFGIARYRFLGFMASDGTFALLTRAGIPPLTLSINGIEVQLPFTFDGQLTLSGQINDARRFAEVHAQGRGTWDIVPGVLRVSAGVRRPVDLRLSSNGRFGISGDGAVEFFGGALRVAGAIDASESHIIVAGALNFSLGGTRMAPAIRIHADGTAQVGPGNTWSFGGRGDLRIFNLVIADVAARITDRDVTVQARIPRRNLRLGKLRFDALISGEIAGQIRFPRRGSAEMRLAGTATVQALGAKLSGSVAITANDHLTNIVAEGALSWMGKEWFAARVGLSSDGSAQLAGRTSVALDLTPSKSLFGGLEVASLFLRADFSASFDFSRSGNLANHDIELDWSLGVRFPGGAPGQTFILAMQKIHIPSGSTLNHKLIGVNGMNFVPVGDMVIPIPKITLGGYQKIIRARIKIPVIDQVRFMMTDELRLYLENLFNDPGFVFGRKVLFELPTTIKQEIEERRLSEIGASLGFSVRLRWKNERLGFELRRGSARQFISLEDLL